MSQASPQTGVVNIRGKEYKTVALRVQEFAEANKDRQFSLVTEIVSMDQSVVVMVAKVMDRDGRVLATGHAEEVRSAGMINKTSALENCETSAIGRALAAFGFGGSEFASANEVQAAMERQKPASREKVAAIVSMLDAGQLKRKHLQMVFGTSDPSSLSDVEADRVITGFQAKHNDGDE